ncbi:MAG TPA: DUF1565 domain-containing protein, partial [Labilithrix sp.]|nr:DUF1565 domain-containing protein [Labilithrix sp.]
MRTSLFHVPVIALFAAALHLHCSSDPVSCDEAHTCGGTDGGGPEGSADAPVDVPKDCDAAAEPKDAPKCVVSDFGVFVDATSGSNTNPGTKDSPVKSITAALAKLAGKPRVYVCEGSYL